MPQEFNENLLLSSSRFIKQKEYWVNRLSGYIDIEETGLDFKQKVFPAAGKNWQKRETPFSPALSARLVKLGKQSDLSLYIILLAALKILIHRYSGNRDIIVLSPVYRDNTGDETINRFVFTRDTITGDMTVKDVLIRIKQTVLGAYENQDYPLEKLVDYLNDMEGGGSEKKSISRILCLLSNIHETAAGVEAGDKLVFSFSREEDGENQGIDLVIFYDGRVYESYYIERLSRHIPLLLENMAGDIDTGVSRLCFFSREEQELFLDRINNTPVRYPGPGTINELLEERAARMPDHTALVGREGVNLRIVHLTYRQLNKKAADLATHLGKNGVLPGDIVGIKTERHVEMVIGVLGILKAGAAYLPIDPALPAGRVKRILADSQVRVVLTGRQLSGMISGSGNHAGNPAVFVKPGNPVYVIYTSGSTGSPRGVMIAHDSLVNRLNWLQRKYPLDDTDVLLLKANFSFDVAVMELFRGILQGSRLCLADPGHEKDPQQLVKAISTFSAAYMHFLPSMLNLLMDCLEAEGNIDAVSSLKRISVGGEPLDLPTARKFARVLSGGITLHNLYGTSETIIDVAGYDFPGQGSWDRVCIGKPADNIGLYILDRYGNVQPAGVPGELHVYGETLANGYLNNPELTAEKFDHDLWDYRDYHDKKNKSFCGGPGGSFFKKSPLAAGGTLYKTGDLACWLPDGNIEFIGRKDNQVKIRGFRVELGEIETCLKGLDSIKNAVVVKREDKTGGFSLVCYLVPSGKPPRETGGLGVVQFEEAVKKYPDRAALVLGSRTWTYDFLNRYANRLAHIIGERYDDRYSLDTNEKTRYKRQMLLDGWGAESQEILKGTAVFVAGAGGSGSPTITQLALCGVGTIIICDYDNVELSNLNRQFLHDESRIGMPKADSARLTVHRINPHINVIPFREKITRENVFALVGDAAVIFDCVDDLETKFVLSECAAAGQIPHIVSVMLEIDSYVTVFHSPRTPCFFCLHDENKLNDIRQMKKLADNYQKKPFSVASPSLFSSTGVAVSEALKIILGFENPAYNRYFLFNLKGTKNIVNTDGYRQQTFSFSDFFKQLSKRQGFDWDEGWRGRFLEELVLEKNPDCPLCGPGHAARERLSALRQQIKKTAHRNTTVQYPVQHKENPQKKQTVALLPGNKKELEMETLPALIGTLKSGKHYVLLDPTDTREQLPDKLENSGCRLILTTGKNRDRALQLRDRVNKHIGIVTIDMIDMDVCGEGEDNPAGSAVPGGMAPGFYSPLAEGKTLYLDNITAVNGRSIIPAVNTYLSGKLPGYMIPSLFVLLEEMPLTATGKVNRRALPEPISRVNEEKRVTAPRDGLEAKLVDIWADVLEKDNTHLGIDANFFDSGGHSLKATVMAARIHKELKVRVPISEVYRLLTVRRLAEYIKLAEQEKFSPLVSTEKKEYYCLSSAQARLFVIQRTDPGSTVYNMTARVKIQGHLDIKKLEEVFRQLIKRHESLRTSFELIANIPVQRIHDHVDFAVEYYADEHAVVGSDPGPRPVRPFDLSRAPLLRVGLITGSEEDSRILLVDMHHIIADGTSVNILIKEFAALYNHGPVPGLMLQYKDYAVWQNRRQQKETLAKQETYWLNLFADGVPAADMPFDYRRPDRRSFEGGSLDFSIGKEAAAGLKKMTAANDVTLFAALLAIFNVLLHKYTGQEDIVIGTVTAGRSHAGVQNIMGMFINMLPLRNYPGKNKTFKHFLQEVKNNGLHALENQDYPYEELLRKLDLHGDAQMDPLNTTVFSMVDNPGIRRLARDNITMTRFKDRREKTKFDLHLIAEDKNDGIALTLTYAVKLFKKSTIERISTHYFEIMDQVLENEEIKLEDIRISHSLSSASSSVVHEDGDDFLF